MKVTNYQHFIFDESNYTELPINDNKMEILYPKQEIFPKNIKYIIIYVVDIIDETQEKIESVPDHLYNYIQSYFQIDLYNSVIALFSIKSRRIRIKTGEKTRKFITDDEASEMINHLGGLMGNNDYYNAWIKLIDDIDYYRNKNTNNVLVIILVSSVFGGIFLIAIVLAIIFGKKGSSDSSNNSIGYTYTGGFMMVVEEVEEELLEVGN